MALIRQTKYVVMMTKEGSTKIVNLITRWAGVLVLGRGHISHILKMHYFFKNLLFTQVKIRQSNQLCSNDEQGMVYQIINFMTPRAGVLVQGCGHISRIVKMHYFFKNLLLYSQTYIKQTKYIVMMNKEGSTKIVNFMTPRAGVLVLGCGHISHIVKMHYFLKNLHLNSHAYFRQN